MSPAEITQQLGLQSLKHRAWVCFFFLPLPQNIDIRNIRHLLSYVYYLTTCNHLLTHLFPSQYIQSTCATTGDGLYEGLEWLATALKKASPWAHFLKPSFLHLIPSYSPNNPLTTFDHSSSFFSFIFFLSASFSKTATLPFLPPRHSQSPLPTTTIKAAIMPDYTMPCQFTITIDYYRRFCYLSSSLFSFLSFINNLPPPLFFFRDGGIRQTSFYNFCFRLWHDFLFFLFFCFYWCLVLFFSLLSCFFLTFELFFFLLFSFFPRGLPSYYY